MSVSIKWVIWGLDTKGDIIFHTKVCKKPSMTKEYKNLDSQMSKGNVTTFGFLSYEKYVKGNYWLNSSNQFKELG